MAQQFRFPQEIEDEIFKWTIHIHPHLCTDAQLTTVSKRVQKCIEPLLYQTIKICGSTGNFESQYRLTHEDKFAVALNLKPQTFFQKHVKNLLFVRTISKGFVRRMLSTCTGIRHLSYVSDHRSRDDCKLIASLPLLSITADKMTLDALSRFKCKLPQVTHLKTAPCFEDDLTPILDWMPALTRVTMEVYKDHEHILQSLRNIIKSVKRLEKIEVFIQHFDDWYDRGYFPEEEIDEWKEVDPRIEVVELEVGYISIWEEMVNSELYDSVSDYIIQYL
ncbi:hypothetical protein BDQ17DRAFT_1428191 [Cyathus striatus]|nr:hypothetical protein BDQ17DRAFT_1428191 [Cyathus striatus]